ncbi:ferritin-like domain-containing protein [Bacillus tianshenii]|nr:ferritin-like domain-containing protein [Bacillus tianshenii]
MSQNESRDNEMNSQSMSMPMTNMYGNGMMPVMPTQAPYGMYGQMMPYKSFQNALKLIQESVQSERADELFYDYLISLAPTKEEKKIIKSIRNDERKHNKMLRAMYQALTGQQITTSPDVTFEKPASYIDGIKQALFGELAAMERYRDIRAGLPTRYFRDVVFEILTDEMKHADKYNYILNAELRRKIGM